MRKVFEAGGRVICNCIDFFYPPFKKLVGKQFFRYGVSGAGNLCFDWVLYFIVYNFVLDHKIVHLGPLHISAHIAALFITFPITLSTGFLLQKYVTFTESGIRGKVQLYRYSIVVMANLLLNYLGLKLLVDILFLYPTPSKMCITIVTTIFSYFSQKKFTFKTSNGVTQ